jgi:hypothetical protein
MVQAIHDSQPVATALDSSPEQQNHDQRNRDAEHSESSPADQSGW